MKKSIPDYETTLPISKKQIRFRPLLVKEEKYISEIMELSNNISEKIYCLSKLVDSCCDTHINSMNISIYDFQHILTEIRRKSINEVLNIKINCPYTGESIPVQINLDELILNKFHPEKKMNFLVNDTIQITFDLPKVSDLIKTNGEFKTQSGFKKLVSLCLTGVETKKEKIDLNLYSDEDKEQFIDLLSRTDYDEIRKFLLNGLYKFNVSYITSDGIGREVVVADFINFLKFYLATLI